MASVLFSSVISNSYEDLFYDFSEYHTICIASVGYLDSGIDKSRFTELRLWLLRHVTEEVVIHVGRGGGISRSIDLKFSKEEDLTFFKLSHWGELIIR